MERYKIIISETDHGLQASCPAFGIAVDAFSDQMDPAVDALCRLMEREAMDRLERGDFLPADEPIETKPGMAVLYVRTDYQDTFVRKSETVRRNVSIPSWIDVRLRRNNVDASRLFQDAALAKLTELETTGKGLRKISTISDLKDACVPEVLDKYVMDRVGQMFHVGQACLALHDDMVKRTQEATIEGFAHLLKEGFDFDD